MSLIFEGKLTEQMGNTGAGAEPSRLTFLTVTPAAAHTFKHLLTQLNRDLLSSLFIFSLEMCVLTNANTLIESTADSSTIHSISSCGCYYTTVLTLSLPLIKPVIL